jgi:predicted phage-related endonuclease
MSRDNEIRKASIGGSCALRIMDGDWHDLWLEKMGLKNGVDLSDVLPVQLGVWTEEFNIKWFSKHMQVECFKDPNAATHEQRYHYKWNGVPCRATLDAEFMMRGERYGLECKHTNDRSTMRSQLERYMPQLQLYLEISGVKAMYFANIFGNGRYEYVKVAKDQQFLEQMFVHLKEFWDYVVREEEPPQAMPHLSVGIDQIPIDDMVARDASSDNYFRVRAAEYISTKEAAKEHAAAGKDLKAMVGLDEREVYTDELSIKRDKRGSLRINIKKGN